MKKRLRLLEMQMRKTMVDGARMPMLLPLPLPQRLLHLRLHRPMKTLPPPADFQMRPRLKSLNRPSRRAGMAGRRM